RTRPSTGALEDSVDRRVSPCRVPFLRQHALPRQFLGDISKRMTLRLERLHRGDDLLLDGVWHEGHAVIGKIVPEANLTAPLPPGDLVVKGVACPLARRFSLPLRDAHEHVQ